MNATLHTPRKRALVRGGKSAAAAGVAAAAFSPSQAGIGTIPGIQHVLTGEVADLAAERARELRLRGGLRTRLLPLLAASDFAFELLRRHPQWTAAIAAGHEPEVVFDPADPALSLVRRQHAGALACIAADVIFGASAATVCARMSTLAQDAIGTALDFAESELIPRHGQPQFEGKPVGLVVYGMGKLGGGELNFSSDLDLVMAYAEGGETAGPRALDHQEYFGRATRRCAQLLSDTTGEGQAWRIDLRLRPFGQAGQLALSFAAMEHYFQREGRDWERYAWIKARPVAGDLVAGASLLESLRPFIYRRYLDYAAFEGLREMKALIDAEVRRQGMEDNLKLGPGGIREIEFLIQLEQLIRAGRIPELRTQGTAQALAALQAHAIWDEDKIAGLGAAYRFLRRLENRVQMLANAQTHNLPGDALSQARIAQTLGYADWDELLQALELQRAEVSTHFAAAVLPAAARTVSAEAANSEAAHQLWQRLQMEQANAPEAPAGMSPELWSVLRQFGESHAVRGMSARSRARLDRVVPLLWSLAQQTEQPELTARRLIEFLNAVARRTAYLALLAEQPNVARMLVRLIGASAWAANCITRTPLVLDELIDARLLKEPVTPGALAQEWQLQHRVRSREPDDEAEVESLKQFQQSVMLKLAAQFLFASRAPGSVLRGLADLADQVLKVVVAQAWRSMLAQHGHLPREGGFAVLAYGSLGGRELNFASDLDLVFIYDEALGELDSDGGRPLDGHRYFVRLAQRILHLLTVATSAGPLYEVDTRLRPDGRKGLLVSACDRFERYQLDDAWTWEHQALVRARFVVGDPALRRRFERNRMRVLTRERPHAQLLKDVAAMRARMRTELDRSNAERFDLKQGHGGLVDLEFALQAIVLGAGNELLPAGRRWPSTTTGLLRKLRHILLKSAATLRAAHSRWTHLGLAATLAGQPRLVALDSAELKLRERVREILVAWLGRG